MAWLASPAHAAVIGAERCEALARADYSGTRDAPFVVKAAKIVAAGTGAYCMAEGRVAPTISFEMRLPLSGWNGGFVLVGSGGWATEKFVFLCREPLARGYACIAGDAGHRDGRGEWLRSEAQSRIDWGYRATHVTALAGKALAQALYGEAPLRSLMIGCSTGGYQGLVEAQRFPDDFAGIVAVAPDMDEAGLAMRTAWTARNLLGVGGAPLFTPHDLAVLHRAVLRRCDLSDGVRDGVVGDPLACRFDPRSIVCGIALAKACLTPRQALAAARIYAGPTTSAGERLGAGGLLPGSELNWAAVGEDTFPDEFLRAVLTDARGFAPTTATFDFDRDPQRLGLAGTLVDTDPDLRRFRRAGGRLMLVQGGDDATEQPRVLVDYYETVERVAGGRGAARDFARLFVVPGMGHCTGGDGAFAIDYLAAIERWVGGRAPARLVAAHVPAWAMGLRGLAAGLTAPSVGQAVTFTRPVYPFPLHARYSGRGDVRDLRSFRPAASSGAFEPSHSAPTPGALRASLAPARARAFGRPRAGCSSRRTYSAQSHRRTIRSMTGGDA